MKRIFPYLNFLLITAMIYLGVDAFYKIASAKFDITPSSSTSRLASVAAKPETRLPITEYKTIIDRNLFKMDLGKEEKPKQVAVESLKQTELKVKLWGTVTGNDGKTFAVIEQAKGREQNLYKAGDTLQDAVIKLILREKVVLHVNGKDEILEMEKIQSQGSAPRRRASVRAPTRQRAPVQKNIVLKRSQFEGELEDPEALVKQVQIRPHFTDGKPDGIMLTGIKPRSIFRRMGLRNGDIIIGVDEDAVQSADDAVKFYQNIGSGEATSIRIKRRGRVQTLNYKIQ
jgi:general secretion pathway protein C